MGRNIILCCDGTGQSFEANKSNPLRLFYCLERDATQLAFYDPGVGTLDPNGAHYDAGLLGRAAASLRRTVKGMGFGAGIVRNIQDAYRYLMQVHQPGDRVFLFGFSRGAFTAQAVAGLLGKCGLLEAHNENLIPYATALYLGRDNETLAANFKSWLARPVTPVMLGVWDTVKSLGHAYAEDYFYDKTAVNCQVGFHALSIDEKRKDFQPRLWTGDQPGLQQVWFAGVHADVGGGYTEDGLSNCALRWMADRAREQGVRFQEERLERFQPNPAGTMHQSLTGWWKLRGSFVRQIPDEALIHPSAVSRRRNAIDGYAPSNWPDQYQEWQPPVV